MNIIANSNPIIDKYFENIPNEENEVIRKKSDLTVEKINSIQPDFIFFPHWSYMIPEKIFTNYECVVFHMTDLPFGRGGSPLQNLISRGYKETKITALRVIKELDAGPVYLKRDLSLHGTAEEIFLRAGRLIREMIIEMINSKPKPKPQQGEPVVFKRRKPEMSNIGELQDLEKVYDYIRMLDAEGYPKAFIETDNLRFEFSRASYKSNDTILADVKISKK